ncbi:hypothetical protein ACFL0L_00380 [Patescibacteria group bacterium]
MEKKPIFKGSVVVLMWRVSIFIAAGIFILLFLYVYSIDGIVDLFMISKVVAGTAALMIGISFALSGFTYYFDFLDTKIGYRKYIGLTGFWLALAYSIMLVFIDPDRYFYGFFENIGSADFILGLSAVGILAFMAIISNSWAMHKLGPLRWRQLLRFGYVAYALLVTRAIVTEWDLWTVWWNAPETLPPPRLTISVIAIIIILFRISMIISKFIKQRKVQYEQKT